MGSSLYFITFSCLDFLLHFGEDLCLVFIRTGDHKIPAHKFWFQVAWNIEKEVNKLKKRGQHLAIKRGFLENLYLSLSGGTRYSESRSPYNEEERGPTAQTLVNSLGTVVLGQWSWDSGLGTLVLGQWSWDSGLGTVVLGH